MTKKENTNSNVLDFVEIFLEKEFYKYHDKIYDFSIEHWEQKIIDDFEEWKADSYLETLDDEEYFVHYLVWYIFNLPIFNNKTIYIEFLRKELLNSLSELTEEMLISWKDSYPSLYEITAQNEDSSYILQDVFNANKFTVKFNPEEIPSRLGNHILGLLVPVGSSSFFFGGYTELNFINQEKFIDSIRKNKNAEIQNKKSNWDTYIKKEFPKILAYFFRTINTSDLNSAELFYTSLMDEKQLEVLDILRNKLSEEKHQNKDIELAVKLWQIYCKIYNPKITNIIIPFAAFDYLLKRINNRSITQKEVALKHKISISSLTKFYKNLIALIEGNF